MHTEKMWIVILIVVLVLAGSNLMMLGIARSMKNTKINFFKNMNDAANPWKKEDEGLKELNERVKEIKEKR